MTQFELDVLLATTRDYYEIAAVLRSRKIPFGYTRLTRSEFKRRRRNWYAVTVHVARTRDNIPRHVLDAWIVND